MKFWIYKRRREGRERLRHEWSEDRYFGTLLITEEFADELRRGTRTAKLVGSDEVTPVPGVDPLYDAVLTSARPGFWVMAGYELVNMGNRYIAFGQSWILIPADEDYERKEDARRVKEQRKEPHHATR